MIFKSFLLINAPQNKNQVFLKGRFHNVHPPPPPGGGGGFLGGGSFYLKNKLKSEIFNNKKTL